MADFVHLYPTACSENLMYKKACNGLDILGTDWTQGFWTGMLWLSYELTDNELFRAVAEAQFDDYKRRYDEYDCLYHHDIGFLYVPSILAQYKITGSKKAKKLCLKAADILAKRYSKKAKIIQVRDKSEQGEFIVDCSMNIPLLYWASNATGDRSYYLKALNHITQVANHIVRDDASTHQCFKIDEVTGEPIRGWQGQGYDDHSCWARGQSWVIYGLALSYKYTKEKTLLDMAKRVSNYFLNRLPSDNICNWDIMFTEDDVARDSSAAPIVACGLLEIAKHLDNDDIHKELYIRAATNMMMNLAEKYTTRDVQSNGILKHGVYCKDKGDGGLGDDECCIWGDYFYMEGLIRLKKDWQIYW
jgi:unsaturated chondroitin disaccharide hydrolase